jgi:predicted HAD superfamily Cof-like phosphohydrolase
MSAKRERPEALVVLEEVLLAARQAALKAKEKASDDSFAAGKVTAYYDVLTVALEQAELMGIDPAEFGMAGFDPDSLLGRNRQAA